MALLAESFHTLSDLFISGFLLIAILWSRKSADKEHMIGHGRAQNVAALSGVEGPWVEYIGPDSIHVDLQVKVASGISIDDANTIARAVRQRVQKEMNYLYCSVHPEPQTNSKQANPVIGFQLFL